jgi:hypothetical protein
VKNQIQPLDGISLIPLFDRKTESRTKPIAFWANARSPKSHATLLDWPFKLHSNPVDGRGRKNAKGDGEATPSVLLYDVANDPKETQDLAAQQPERVKKMTAELEMWKTSVEKSLAGTDYVGNDPATAPAAPKTAR